MVKYTIQKFAASWKGGKSNLMTYKSRKEAESAVRFWPSHKTVVKKNGKIIFSGVPSRQNPLGKIKLK